MAGRQLRRYSPEEIDLGLRTLALEGGNSQAAHERLKEGGLDIPSVTLRDWRNTSRVERYQDICVQVAPEIERVVVQRSAEIQRRALDVSLKAIDAAEQQITNGEAKDPSATAKNLALTHGIITDKTLILQGRPTNIDLTLDARDLIAEIRKDLGSIPSTAEDLETTALPADVSKGNARD